VAGYRAQLGSEVSAVIRHFPPEVKRALKAAIRALTRNPEIGEPLHGELEGRLKYRVRRYRIVYQLNRAARVLHVVAVGHRRSIYEEVAEELRSRK
jgi:mRNA interferase RelE/StbE